MKRATDREIAEGLLLEWFQWADQWRPALGAPRLAPSCRGYRGDEKHNDEGDSYDGAHLKEMKAVEFCVHSIDGDMQKAIGTEMRNRQIRHKVWRDSGGRTFQAALDAVLPLMRMHRDLMALFN